MEANWRDLLHAYLAENTDSVPDELEESARVEKTAALKEIAESRISVVIRCLRTPTAILPYELVVRLLTLAAHLSS